MPLIPKQQTPYYTATETVKIYKAILTQTGTNPPTANIITNTIGNIIWTYSEPGGYIGTLAGAFTGKIWFSALCQASTDSATMALLQYFTLPDSIALFIGDATGTGMDDWSNVSILIEVHP